MRLGLTGGIGSGKSTVAALLVETGAHLIDTDAIARALTAPQGAAMPAIAAEFGADFIAADGALDRDRMRALAFSEASAKRRLEAILHPLIGQTAEAQARAAPVGALLVFDVPLLVESGRWRQRVDKVLVVDCEEATQVERVSRRPGWDADRARGVIAAQASRRERRAAADAVIVNEGLDLDALRREVMQLVGRWRAL
jgi:dephospho-CoA kinase